MNWEDYFYYDESSPSCLRWKVDRYRGKNHCTKFISIGESAGSFGSYFTVEIDYVQYKCHRIVWELLKGLIPEDMVVDHIDRDVRNNKIDNLRLVSRAVNSRNARISSNNTSGVTGVRQHSDGKGNLYWKVKWIDLTGKECSKFFSIKKYGDAEAFRLAVEKRNEEILKLNAQGAGYTQQHGK